MVGIKLNEYTTKYINHHVKIDNLKMIGEIGKFIILQRYLHDELFIFDEEHMVLFEVKEGYNCEEDMHYYMLRVFKIYDYEYKDKTYTLYTKTFYYFDITERDLRD